MAINRYEKQTRFRELGVEGQARLGRAHVTIVGVGATGSFLAGLFARAGVGSLRLIDRDFVEIGNLHRQTLYTEADAAASTPKAIAAAAAVHSANTDLSVEPIVTSFGAKNATSLLRDTDLVLDGTDNFAARYLLNDACLSLNLPWVYTGVIGGHGVSLPVLPGGPCLRCYLPTPPLSGQLETCDTSGILGATVSAVASFSATAALKILLGRTLDSCILNVDVWDADLAALTVRKNPQCQACVLKNFEFLQGKFEPDTVALCGRNSVHIQNPAPENFRLAYVIDRVRQIDSQALASAHTLKFAADGVEFVVFKDGRAILKGISDTTLARSLYSRYIEG